MDVVGSEIGQKMRSAIKAKLTELGCYVDDELPDYVMVMVANKRTRAQMEDDLQLFLGDNTELFVNWLHQVLKKLQEVTIPPLKPEAETTKEKSKEKKSKDKKEKKDKDKDKSKQKRVESAKKLKKKDKVKEKLRKKEEKKSHKSKDKKKSKHHGMIRPNIPPLLMNIEKESEPSITDVFAGQILKNHGILIEDKPKEEKPETKPIVIEINKIPMLPIIDPASISSQPESNESTTTPTDNNIPAASTAAPRDEQIKEMNEIEAKIQGLKQKLAEQLDSMSEDEDFLNIRTEAEELMNDFAEDVFQEISSQAPPAATPPLSPTNPPTTAPESPAPKVSETPEEPPVVMEPPKPVEPETLPQIELKLPKRPVRERLGAKEDKRKTEGPKGKEVSKVKSRLKSPERFTPDREPDFWGKFKSARSRLGSPPEATRKSPITFKRRSSFDNSDDSDSSSNKKERKGSAAPARVSCASVVRVKPRPRAHVPSSLLLRAVADAHKSLLNIPPKIPTDPPKIKRALVHPMRRLDGPNIVIQIPAERPASLGKEDDKRNIIDLEKEEYTPSPLVKKQLAEYLPAPLAPPAPPAPRDRVSTKRDDTLIIETINIHNPTVDKDKKTQFIVTMDGFNPNAFLAKKLKTEGLLDDELELTPKGSKSVLKISPVARATGNEEKNKPKEIDNGKDRSEDTIEEQSKLDDVKKKHTNEEKQDKENVETKDGAVTEVPQKKRLSDTSDDSDTQVIIKPENISEKGDKRNSVEAIKEEESAPKKRKASPIVFDVVKKETEDVERKRERTESANSDNHVKVTTLPKTHKYDALPPLSATETKAWCRAFPLCRYGSSCAFLHPRCKFAAGCTRRSCPYSHAPASPSAPVSPQPAIASHVVAPASYKSVRALRPPAVCAFAPHCTNALCGFAHPPPARPCRYGRACAHRDTCNFAHPHAPPANADRWRYPV